MAAGVYRILNTQNNKCYIGSAVDLRARWGKHRRELRKGAHHSAKLQRAWNKYGEESFIFEPLLTCARSMLITYEQQCMNQLTPEYNILLTAGSCLGRKHSAETRAKISQGNIGNKNALGLKRPAEFAEMARIRNTGKVVTAVTRAKISASKANIAPEIRERFRLARKGKPLTPEHLERLRTQNIGRKATPEAVANMCAAQKGRKISDEHKEKLRQVNLGKRHTAESKAKMSASRAGRAQYVMTDEIRAKISAGLTRRNQCTLNE